MLDYLAVGIVYADYNLLANFITNKEDEYGVPYRKNKFGIRLIAYLFDFILWPIGIMSDVGLF